MASQEYINPNRKMVTIDTGKPSRKTVTLVPLGVKAEGGSYGSIKLDDRRALEFCRMGMLARREPGHIVKGECFDSVGRDEKVRTDGTNRLRGLRGLQR